jgi:hypothetical protein
MVFMDWFSFIDTKMFCSLRTWTKENILSKKEIGEYYDRKCHRFCAFNFYKFLKKPVLLVYAIDTLLEEMDE